MSQCICIAIANNSASINVFVLFVFTIQLHIINQNALGKEGKNNLNKIIIVFLIILRRIR